jgi:hypothetical protein
LLLILFLFLLLWFSCLAATAPVTLALLAANLNTLSNVLEHTGSAFWWSGVQWMT